MVKIRLQRMGRKKRPEYRVVVADSRMPRDGRFIERIGVYYPQTPEGDKQVRIDMDRAKYWLGVGAQPSDTVRGLLHRVGVLEGKAPSLGKPNQPSKAELEAAKRAEEAAAAEASAGEGGEPAAE